MWFCLRRGNIWDWIGLEGKHDGRSELGNFMGFSVYIHYIGGKHMGIDQEKLIGTC